MYSYLFCPPIFHDPSFHCSLFLIHICELLLLMSYSFSVSPYVPFPFLRLATPLPMCHPRIRVLFSLYTTIVLVQCTSIVIIILYLHLSFSSCLVWRPSFVSRRSFCRSSSHSVLFFSLVVFYVVVRRIFFWCAPKFYCCIFILLSRANNSHLSTAPISNCLL